MANGNTQVTNAAVESVFSPAELVEIKAQVSDSFDNVLRGAALWDAIVQRYIIDPITAPRELSKVELARKREISALYKVEGERRNLADGVAKKNFSRGTGEAEVRCGLRAVPVNTGTKSGGKGTKTATETTQTQTTASGTANPDTAHTLECMAMAREIAERVKTMQGNMAGYLAGNKLTKAAQAQFGDLVAEIGRLAEIVGALNVKIGNVPAQ